ncbi:hypothetical protein IWW34DRAFT_642522 [Fusarium oxysporum f. sp. albedinis]|nr:hypothetical protein IWW34DRAFT_642522 [Fusarium oxysporum f. sp. albedinis]
MCTIPDITWTCPHCGTKSGHEYGPLLKCRNAEAGNNCNRRSKQPMAGPRPCHNHKHLPIKGKAWYENL